MRSAPVLVAASLSLLAACTHASRADAERFHFDIKFLGGGQACSVETTELATKATMFVQVALPRDRRDNHSSYENGDTDQILAVKLVHDDKGKYRCSGAIFEHGKMAASDFREQ